MLGLLVDVNVQGHLPLLRRSLELADLWSFLGGMGLTFATFRDCGLAPDTDDRALWTFCQREGWILFTENRNADGPDSLERTLSDSWTEGSLPIITLANKSRFERDRDYAGRVAIDVADILFGVAEHQYRDRPRIYVPLRS